MPKDITNNPFIDQLGLPKQGEQKKDSNTLAQEQFLELLVAQIENQNPLKPQDNGEFLGQMAQFSTVSGLQQMQKSIDQLNAPDVQPGPAGLQPGGAAGAGARQQGLSARG